MSAKCPGQDQRFWKPEDIFEVSCPYCGRRIEFWRDEPFRMCRSCGREVRNPRIDLACAEWCTSADECLGRGVGGEAVAGPYIERLTAELERRLHEHPENLERARTVCAECDALLQSEQVDPRLAKPAALLAGAALRPEFIGREDRTPQGDEEILDTLLSSEILAQAGFEEDHIEVIEEIVRAVFAPGDGDRAESLLVWDAVQLALDRTARRARTGNEKPLALHTRTAKKIAMES